MILIDKSRANPNTVVRNQMPLYAPLTVENMQKRRATATRFPALTNPFFSRLRGRAPAK